MWDRRAKLIDVHDGDTVTVILDQGFGDTKQIKVRLLAVYAPELTEPGGPDCREFVRQWFMSQPFGWSFIVTTARTKVADHEQTTLDRYVGTITSLDGSSNLNVEVEAFIRAKGYSGGIGAP